MKKKLFIFVLGFLALSISGYSQIKVLSNGYVAINKSSADYNLDLYGTARYWSTGWGQLHFNNSGHSGVATIHPYDDWVGCLGKTDRKFNKLYVYDVHYDNLYDWSDERLKENINPLKSSLDKILLLNGVSYNMKKDFYNIKDSILLSRIMDSQKRDFGFLAQEINEVIPEVVSLDTTCDLYSVNYVKLIPVLVEAIKEQQSIIEELSGRIETIEKDCCNTSLKSASLSAETNNELVLKEAKLYQNTPNPFTEQTEIKCFIPEEATNVIMFIYNMQGNQLEQFQVTGTGNQTIMLQGNELMPGMYFYSLVVDGREIDTKKMILTK